MRPPAPGWHGGRSVTYRERDTPLGHVIREHPDGTKKTIKIDLAAEARAA